MKRALLMTGLCLALSTPALATGGAGSSGGGSLVYVNGQLEPADLYSTVQPPQPENATPVDFKNYKDGVGAFQYALGFLKARSDGATDFSQWDFARTEFYFVPKLSGEDLLPVTAGLPEVQVAYTYEMYDFSGQHQPKRIIVELLQNLFDQLSPDNQALVLTHEFMHHKSYGQHWVIAPIIQDLNVLIPLSHLQEAGNRALLTDAQLAASQDLQNILGSVTGASDFVTRNGGGIVLAGPKASPDANFVGATSRLICHDDCVGVSGNTLVGSRVEIQSTQASGNLFVRSNIELVGDEPTDRNVFEDSLIQNSAIQEVSVAEVVASKLKLVNVQLPQLAIHLVNRFYQDRRNLGVPHPAQQTIGVDLENIDVNRPILVVDGGVSVLSSAELIAKDASHQGRFTQEFVLVNPANAN